MHKVKTAARRHAWYNDDDHSSNLNPFAKHGVQRHRSHSEAEDLESGSLPSNFRSASEGHYRSGGRAYPGELGPIPGSSHSPRSLRFEPQQGVFSERESQQPTNEAPSGSTETDQTLAGDKEATELTQQQPIQNVTTNSSDLAGPRNRKMGGLLGRLHRKRKGKGEVVHEANLEPTESRTSRKKAKPEFTFANQIRNTLLNSPINILLIAAPVGIALNYTSVPPVAIFVVNFIAIIPLAAMLSYATEEIALRTGETFGGLLNASFGNATELIVSIIALFANEIVITQTSLIGSMLSNLLLVMGMCFFFGGLTRVRQHFNVTVAQTASSLLALALAGLIVPTVFDNQTPNDAQNTVNIAAISRGVAVLLLLVYGCYLFFQLKTHAEIYSAPSVKEPKRNIDKGEASRGIARIGQLAGVHVGNQVHDNVAPNTGEDEDEVPKLHIWVAVATLAIATALIAICSDFLVNSIDDITSDPNSKVSKNFIGLILLPIVGNAAEHATAVTVACKDKMDLAIGVAVGSSMQIALLVLPLVVIIGWIAGNDQMTLDFDNFQVVILFVSVLLVNYLIADGESHWLEGVMLMGLYLMIAVAAWYYPQETQTG